MRSRSRPWRTAVRESALVADGVVGRPLQSGVAATKLGSQARQGRRAEGLGKDRKAGAAIGGMSLGQLTPGRHEIAPGLPRPLRHDDCDRSGCRGRARTPGPRSSRPPSVEGCEGVSFDLGRGSLRGSRRSGRSASGGTAWSSRSSAGSGNSLSGAVTKGRSLRLGRGTPRRPQRQRGARSIIMSRRVIPSEAPTAPLEELALESGAEFGRSSICARLRQ
jgi:hypothetical protein